jgi:P4 family phage/plasmid primase-like protien
MMTSIKKLSAEEIEQKFNNLLSKCKIEKGKGLYHTHTAFGHPWGSFNITDDVKDEFMMLYSELLGKIDLHITERPCEIGPLLVDLDWNFKEQYSDRQYSDDHIKRIIFKYNKCIKKYFKLQKKQLKAFVFQKEQPTKKIAKETGIVTYKDGFHIVYPHLPISTAMRFLIRDEVMTMVEEDGDFNDIEYYNPLDDVFDKSIIESNAWMMYGSKKNEGYYYKLTNIYQYNLEEENIKVHKNKDLPVLLSNRQYTNDDEIEMKDNINKTSLEKKIHTVLSENSSSYRKNNKTTQNNQNQNNQNQSDSNDGDNENGFDNFMASFKNKNTQQDDNVDDGENDGKTNSNGKKNYSSKNDYEIAKELIKILSVERATDYNKWINVGWALKTISNKLFSSFDTFSKKSSKYDKQYVKKSWDEARTEGYTIRALHRWARQDDYEGYSNIISKNVNSLLMEAENGTENCVAKVIYQMYKDRYVCTSIKNQLWYEFQNHRWVEVEAGYTLKNKMSDELTSEFAKLISIYYNKASAENRGKRDELMRKGENVSKVITKLQKSGFKKSVLEECSCLFLDKTFEELLDSNKDLIGFDNGVYDLKNACFRDGIPEDYVTISVGYEWEDYPEDHPYINEIETFFDSVMREIEMKKYMMSLLASYLDGHTKQQKVIIWTGIGSNGKSVCINFFQTAFGDYCGILPITVLTRKQGGSSGATPELADTWGKRFVVFQEPENDDKLYIGRMKELSGSDWVYARKLFRDPIKFQPQFKLVLTCNKLPHIGSTDGGTWRRLRVTPWESEFVDLDKDGLCYGKPMTADQYPKDYDINEKCEKWKKVFLWHLITHYYPTYRKSGSIHEPEKVKEFTNKYKKDSDIYFEYLDKNIIKTNDKKDTMTIDVIYSGFRYWHKEAYNGGCPVLKQLKEYMENHDYDIKKSKYVYGVKSACDEEVEEEL